MTLYISSVCEEFLYLRIDNSPQAKIPRYKDGHQISEADVIREAYYQFDLTEEELSQLDIEHLTAPCKPGFEYIASKEMGMPIYDYFKYRDHLLKKNDLKNNKCGKV